MLADIWSSAPKHTSSQHSVAKSEQDSCLSGNCCTCVSEMSASRVCSHSLAAADHFKCCCAEHIGVSARSPCRNTVSASSFDSARPKESACRKVVVRLVNISLFMSIAKPSAIRSCGRDCGQDGKMRLRSARDYDGAPRWAKSRKYCVARCKRLRPLSKTCRRLRKSPGQPLHGVSAMIVRQLPIIARQCNIISLLCNFSP